MRQTLYGILCPLIAIALICPAHASELQVNRRAFLGLMAATPLAQNAVTQGSPLPPAPVSLTAEILSPQAHRARALRQTYWPKLVQVYNRLSPADERIKSHFPSFGGGPEGSLSQAPLDRARLDRTSISLAQAEALLVEELNVKPSDVWAVGDLLLQPDWETAITAVEIWQERLASVVERYVFHLRRQDERLADSVFDHPALQELKKGHFRIERREMPFVEIDSRSAFDGLGIGIVNPGSPSLEQLRLSLTVSVRSWITYVPLDRFNQNSTFSWLRYIWVLAEQELISNHAGPLFGLAHRPIGPTENATSQFAGRLFGTESGFQRALETAIDTKEPVRIDPAEILNRIFAAELSRLSTLEAQWLDQLGGDRERLMEAIECDVLGNFMIQNPVSPNYLPRRFTSLPDDVALRWRSELAEILPSPPPELNPLTWSQFASRFRSFPGFDEDNMVNAHLLDDDHLLKFAEATTNPSSLREEFLRRGLTPPAQVMADRQPLPAQRSPVVHANGIIESTPASPRRGVIVSEALGGDPAPSIALTPLSSTPPVPALKQLADLVSEKVLDVSNIDVALAPTDPSDCESALLEQKKTPLLTENSQSPENGSGVSP